MMRSWVLLLFTLAGCNMLPSSGSHSFNAQRFGNNVAGLTLDFYAPAGAEMSYIGTERFLPDNRTVLMQDGCYEGSWERVGSQICFSYPALLNEARHCYTVEAPITDEGVITIRTELETFEFRQSRREVPTACPG